MDIGNDQAFSRSVYLCDESGESAFSSSLPLGRGETILLADRDNSLRELGCSLLTKLNYQVVTAYDREQVVDVCCNGEKKIDLLIMDTAISCPKEPNLMECIRNYQPQAKTIFYTVCDWLFDPECRNQIGSGSVIQKPYSIQELSCAIARTLS